MSKKLPNTIASLYIGEINKIIDIRSKNRLNQKGEEKKKAENSIIKLVDLKLGIQKSVKLRRLQEIEKEINYGKIIENFKEFARLKEEEKKL